MEVPERIAIVETKVDRLEVQSDKQNEVILAIQLADKEQQTNWKLAATVGGLGGSIFVGIILALAGRLIA